MAKKRKEMGLKQASMGLVGVSTVIGLGASVVEKSGGSAAGLSTVSSFLSPIGATIGAGLVVQQLRKLKKVQKQK